MYYNSNIQKFVFLLIFGMLFTILVFSTCAEVNVELDPEKPKPLGTITFKAKILDAADVEKVFLIVEECGNEPDFGYICYTDKFNETMAESSNNNYTTTITLRHENAIEIKYQIKYLNQEGWVTYPDNNELIELDLDTSNQTDNGQNQDTNDNGSDTPGFEVATIIIVFTIILLINRKRLK